MRTPSTLPFALVVVVTSALAPGCRLFGIGGEPCAADADCAATAHCGPDGLCVDGGGEGGSAEGEGEGGSAEGEGEGTEGEGEGSEGEGEGSEGEGSEGEGSEGEGSEGEGSEGEGSEGEGSEGEGSVGEGEGEGEGASGPVGDPNVLTPSITSSSTCDPIGTSLYWPVTDALGDGGLCEVDLTNSASGPVDVTSVQVLGSAFTLIDVFPAATTTLAPGEILKVTTSATAAASGLRTGELHVHGARDLVFPLLIDAASATPKVEVRADGNSCNTFGNVDTRADTPCAMLLVNTGPGDVTLQSGSLDDQADFDTNVGQFFFTTITSRHGVPFHVFALNGPAGAASGVLTLNVAGLSPAIINLSATWSEAHLAAAAGPGCVVGGGLASCTFASMSVSGASRSVALTLDNDALVDVEVDALDANTDGRVTITAVELVPYFLNASEQRTLTLIAAPVNGASTGPFAASLDVVDANGKDLGAIALSGTLTP